MSRGDQIKIVHYRRDPRSRSDREIGKAIEHRLAVLKGELRPTDPVLCPELPLSTWATLDGNVVPAWTPQKSAKCNERGANQ